MSIVLSLAASLALTLILELGFALLWGARGRDFPRIALVNVLTNPAVVLCRLIARAHFPAALPAVTFALEAGAIVVEGWLLSAKSGVRWPWFFALCANLFSFTAGLLL